MQFRFVSFAFAFAFNIWHSLWVLCCLAYWEADTLGTTQYPEGVKFITASFADYFGNETGTYIRVRAYWYYLVRKLHTNVSWQSAS